MLLPLLVSTPPTPLPATSVAYPRVPSVMASEVVYGAVNAPGWVMPVAAACAGLIPVSFLAIVKGAGAPAGAVKAGIDSSALRARDRLFAIANRHRDLGRRLRREGAPPAILASAGDTSVRRRSLATAGDH